MKEQSLSLPVWNARFLSMWEDFKTGICEVVPKCKTKIQRICIRIFFAPLPWLGRCSLVGVSLLAVMRIADVDMLQWWICLLAVFAAVTSVVTFLRIFMEIGKEVAL